MRVTGIIGHTTGTTGPEAQSARRLPAAGVAPDDVSDEQMQMLVRYLLYHYRSGLEPAPAGK